ncbi:DEKNAAC105534 [Brettanomyces naardenensis]|uniref:Origin recognition complex subunit 1 n=1 Tax=Brettanomyces naardenensis TaxID=13370 RepID=A0A448YTY3_BRENA|nr:DEKNAAC105534 [Brettanomyces naardenensis]
MAKSMRQMKGWQYSLEDDPIDSSIADSLPRRSLRGGRDRSRVTGSQIVLRREIDNIEVRVGDTVLVETAEDGEESEEDGRPSIGLVKDILFGTESFLEVRVFWFYGMTEINKDRLTEGYSDNDVFLSPVVDKIELSNILGRCTVISEKSLAKMVIDESNTDTTFICRRFCDSDGGYFTDILDWDEIFKTFKENTDDFYQMVKNLTVKPTVKRFSRKLEKKGIDPRSIKLEEKEMKRKKQERKVRKLRYTESDGSEDDDGRQYDDDAEYDEEDGEDEDDEFYVYDLSNDETEDSGDDEEEEEEEEDSDLDYGSQTKRGTKRRQRRHPKVSKGRKRRFKVGPRKAGPRLPTVARRIEFNEDAKELDIDTIWGTDGSATETSKAFRKAKKVLHTSARLHSLPCREEEFSQLFFSLESAVQSQVGRCIYVSGTPGVGKTATIREVIKQLSASFIAETRHKMFNYVEINGLKLISPQSSYEALWEKVCGKRATASNSLTLLEEYFNREDAKRMPLVVLLDEMDQIVTKSQSVMYNFFNWPSYPNSKLIVIAVANTMDLPERLLTNKISSRLGLTRIQFSSYTYTQLSEIIKSRLEKLGRLNEERMVISKDAIAFASRKVASVSGDARRALMICIRAVEIAEMEFMSKPLEEKKKLDSKYTVTIMHIMKAVNETASSPISNYLGSLSFMSKMFLAAVLLRMKRTGVAEVTVGDVIDELNNQFHVVLFTELKNRLKEEELEVADVLYNDQTQLRPTGLNFLIKDLEENGILIVQQLKLERSRLVRLNISQDEIVNSFKKDTLIREIMVEQ